VEIQKFQGLIRDIYYKKDANRGIEGTFLWLTEEVGELARAIRQGVHEEQKEEFADVFAWLVSLASLCDVDLDQAIEKYLDGCPKCGQKPCMCFEKGVRPPSIS